jgi:hypothetical protein
MSKSDPPIHNLLPAKNGLDNGGHLQQRLDVRPSLPDLPNLGPRLFPQSRAESAEIELFIPVVIQAASQPVGREKAVP